MQQIYILVPITVLLLLPVLFLAYYLGIFGAELFTVFSK